MVDQVDTIATELTLRYAQYVSGVDTVVQTNKRLNKSIADLSKLGVEAPPQYANAAASAAAKGAEAHEKAAARIKTARKATVDAVKQSGSEEIAAEIATQQRLTKAVEDGIAARSNAVRRGSGTVIGSTVPGRANNARQGLLTGTSVDAVATADVAAEREINSLALDTYDLEQKRKVLTGARLADVERELELQRRITVYEREGLTTEEAQVRAEARMVEMETLRAEKEAELALARKAGGSRSGFGGANEFALQASGGRFGYSFGPAAIAGTALAVGAGATIEAIDAATKYADALHKVSTAAGLSAEQLQVYRRAAEDTGASSDDVDRGLADLSKQLAEAQSGSKEAQKAFAALGITIKSGDTVGTILPQIIESLSQVQDKSLRTAAELKLFGQAGADLDQLLSGGNAQISDLAKNLQATGQILSSSDIAHLNEVSKQIAGLKAQLLVDVSSVVARNADTIILLANAFAKLADAALKAVGAVADFLKNPLGVLQFAENPAAAIATAITQRAINGPAKPGFTLKGATFPADGQFLAQGKVTPNNALLRSLNAPAAARGRRGPSADTLENQADERTKRFNDLIARYQDEQLAAVAEQTADEEARRDQQRAQIQRDAAKDIADLRTQAGIDSRKKGADEALIKARLDQAIAARQAVAFEKTNVVNLESNASAIDKDVATQNAILEFKNQQLQAQEELAKTAEERRDLELQILANDQKIAANSAEGVLRKADQGVPTSNADIAAANRTLANLPASTASKTAVINRQTEGPWAQYVERLPTTAKQIDEAFQQAAVSGVERLNDSLDNSISKMLHLHGVAGEFLKDLIQIGLHALEGNLFGGGAASGGGLFGGGGSGLLGSLIGGVGKLFGGGGGFSLAGNTAAISSSLAASNSAGLGTILAGFLADGGPAEAGKTYMVGERGPELLRMGSTGGTVVPNHMIGTVDPNAKVKGATYVGGDTHYNISVSADNSVTPAGFAEGLASQILQKANEMDAVRQGAAVRASPAQVAYDQRRGSS